MHENQIEAVALNAGIDLKFFTGLSFHLSERPVLLIISLEGKPAFIFPEFESEKAMHAGIDTNFFSYPEDPQRWHEKTRNAFRRLRLSKNKIAVPPLSFRFLEINLLQSACPEIKFSSADDILTKMYIQKDKKAIDAVRKAVEIAENALQQTIPDIQPGNSEKEIANKLIINILSSGSEPDLPFSPIVASGPNSADPHATPSDRQLAEGDLLIIDWGARYDGYVSDITRTFFIGDADDQVLQIAKVVNLANQKTRESVFPGVTADQVDANAREVISRYGYGENFIHRTGHGIGLREHEEPFISSTNQTALEEGMVFTVEPGIYIPGKGGIRIEDNVVVTSNGSETLTRLPRELIQTKN